ncbi:hypothetical protein WN944_009235 [Citrus x changshan-huyou]|uniref:GATA-type domain-containing protein n=1 Tax=Citrus x changshan-huyou TaxID=2935761 RepID=A0AAP0QWQ8_9ROSI
MDSQWFNQAAATNTNGCDLQNAGNRIDLTLKLGLPDSSDRENQHFRHFDQMTPCHSNLNIDALNSHEGMNMANNNIGQGFNPGEVAWQPSNFTEQYVHSDNNNNNHYGLIPFQGSTSMGSPPLPIYYPHNINSVNNFNINPNQNVPLAAAAAAPPPMNDYTLLEVPPRRDELEEGSSSAAAPARRRATGTRRPRGGSIIDPNKRCTNYNCKTSDTPMWRRGPLGPKTLCNACGIKYRKEEEKRLKAKEANSQNSNAETD